MSSTVVCLREAHTVIDDNAPDAELWSRHVGRAKQCVVLGDGEWTQGLTCCQPHVWKRETCICAQLILGIVDLLGLGTFGDMAWAYIYNFVARFKLRLYRRSFGLNLTIKPVDAPNINNTHLVLMLHTKQR